MTAAVGALVAGAALSACGQVKMGTAATVGDERITTAQLDRTVAEWRKEFDANRQAALVQQVAEQRGQRLPFDPDSPHRSALYQLMSFKIWDEVARERGIAVSQGQVDSLLGGLGGQSGVSAGVLASDIPLRYTPDIARTVLIQQELLRRYGAAPNAFGQVDPSVQQRALQQRDADYSAAARRLKITINPRFGGFDPQQVALDPVTYRLSRTESGTG
ncbi:MAG TPA: SurA N-terminal domain-containing protein [Streptosporangiaceae bacterium]|nr:SurA N-terminal domain-containing protein [Streptosporangiaceae bacterium]